MTVQTEKSLSLVLDDLLQYFETRPITLGRLLAVLGEQAIAMVLLVFSIPAIIPTPGVPAGMIFGSVLVVLSCQLVVGTRRFWLPKRLARIEVPRNLLSAMVVRLGPKLQWLETWLKPRWTGLSGPAALRPLGAVVVVMGVIIALPIPFGNVLPGLSVFFIALGLAQRDGVAIGIGLAFGVAAIAFTAFILLGGWWLISGWLGWSSGTAPA
ncbi:exopolysaccharide biosynthesis protein [Allorhizobium pseudoryzae]|uniref:exopolysaccharide biosynthesis protein n=1 Tax=Allorhizobium pseudoryzae TaxID=379684 RepID=UPI003D02A5B9